VIGLSVALPLAVARAGSPRGAADVLLCTVLLVTFCGSAYHALAVSPRAFRDPTASRPLLLRQLAGPDPIVASGAIEYLQPWYYAP
jgi:hypothetical protein